MTGRAPFVSGLAGPLADEICSPAALATLARIRTRARAEAAALAPRCSARFDGVERLEADPDAVSAKQDFDALVALIDDINADRVLLMRAAAILARGK